VNDVQLRCGIIVYKPLSSVVIGDEMNSGVLKKYLALWCELERDLIQGSDGACLAPI